MSGTRDWHAAQTLEALPVAVYTTDDHGRITFFNESAVALWGRAPELGKSAWCGSWRLFWPDGRPMRHDECPMAVSLKEGRAIKGAEALAERPDGSRVPFMAYPTPLRDEAGVLTGAVNTLIDITARKQAEEVKQRLGSIVETSDDAIISKDLNGTILSWNEGAERLFGYTADEVIGRSVSILIPDDRPDEEPEILGRLRQGRRIDHYETVRRRKDGALLDISLTVSPLKDAFGGVVGASKIARDISERRRAEERQKVLVKELTHRGKNLLAVIQAIMGSTARFSSDIDEFHERFSQRIAALSKTYSLLTGPTQEIDFRELLCAELDVHGDGSSRRVVMRGPPVRVGSEQAIAIGMAIHELTTNAAKYGALSVSGGSVEIAWDVIPEAGSSRLRFTWAERGGPRVERPTRTGFGSRLLDRILSSQVDGEVTRDYRPEGVVFRAAIPLPLSGRNAGRECAPDDVSAVS